MKADRLASRGLSPRSVIAAKCGALYHLPQSDDPGDNMSG
jgi:hypothetical protein